MLQKGILNEGEENFDSYYMLEKEELDALGLSQLELEEGEAYIVNYDTGEVMMTVPIIIEDIEYYTLSNIKQREGQLNTELQNNTENIQA